MASCHEDFIAEAEMGRCHLRRIGLHKQLAFRGEDGGLDSV